MLCFKDHRKRTSLEGNNMEPLELHSSKIEATVLQRRTGKWDSGNVGELKFGRTEDTILEASSKSHLLLCKNV